MAAWVVDAVPRYRRSLMIFTVVTAMSVAAFVGVLAPATTRDAHAAFRRRRGRSVTLPSRSVRASVTPAVHLPPTGPPYPVGVLHVSYTDTSRPILGHGDEPGASSRVLPVTIRYPALGASQSGETENVAIVGPSPLLVFAHGFGVTAETYAAMEHQLAAAGFVVAAPDFPLTSSASGGPLDRTDLVNQPGDISFLITELANPATVPSVLRNALSPTKVGVIGHSDGGITAAAVAYNACCADPRVGAAVILSGAEAAFDGGWFKTASPPLLAIHGTADEINSFDNSTQLFDDATGPKMLVAVPGGSHLGPFTVDATEPAIANLVAEFMRATLQGDIAAATRLPDDANADGTLALIARS